MNRFRFLPASLLVMLIALPAGAQDAPRERGGPGGDPNARVTAAPGMPVLPRFPEIPLVLPSGNPLRSVLNVIRQDVQGRFSGKLIQRGMAPGRVSGLVEPTEAGGYMIEFTVESEDATQRLFQGAIFVAEAAGNAPRRVHLSGISMVMEGEKIVSGPFPFHGSADMSQEPLPGLQPVNPAGEPAPPPGDGALAPAAPKLRAPLVGAVRRDRAARILTVPGDTVVTPASPKLRSPFLDAVRRERASRELGLPKDAVVTPASPKLRSPFLDAVRRDPAFQAPKNVMEALERRDDLKIFTSLVKTAGLEDAYRKVKITVFAPNDAAFNKLPFGVLDSLRKDQASAKQYVGYCTSYQHKYLTKGPAGAEELPGDVVDVGTARLGVSRVNGRLWIMGNDSRRAPVLEENIDAGVGELYVTGVVLIQKSTRFD